MNSRRICPDVLVSLLMWFVVGLFVASCSFVSDQPRSDRHLEFLEGPESSRKLIVFVHGVFGDMSTWTNLSGQSWPELMRGDYDLQDYRIAAYRYNSPFRSRTSTLQEISTRMLKQLEDADVFRKYKEIYFITHSMGGLVTKRVLVNLNTPASIEKLRLIKAVLYIATPSQGAEIANITSRLSSNPQITDMRGADTNSYLQNLEDEWANLMRQRDADEPFPQSFCAYEIKALYGTVIVDRARATTVCDETPIAFEEDHVSIVKPSNRQSPVYEWARKRIQNVSELVRDAPSTTALQRIEDLQQRAEFSRERDKQLATAALLFQLKRPYTPEELGHFRILVELSGRGESDKSPSTLSFGARDAYWRAERDGALLEGTSISVWSKNPNFKFPGLNFSGSTIISRPTISLIRISQNIEGRAPFRTVESLNGKVLNIFISQSLADKLSFIGLTANNFLVAGFPNDCLDHTQDNPTDWPFKLSEREQVIEWVSLLAKRYGPDDNSRPPSQRQRPALQIDYEKFPPVRPDRTGTLHVTPDCPMSNLLRRAR